MGEATRDIGDDPLAGEGAPDDESAPESERAAEEQLLEEDAAARDE